MALLLGQQAALTHALAHASNDIAGNLNPDKPLPSPDHCDKCASFSHLHAVMHGHATTVSVVFGQSEITRITHQDLTPAVLVAYLARGPPHSI